MAQFDRITKMMVRFEAGKITEVDEIIEFCQRLIDNGLDATCGGHYSNIVQELINKGKVSKDKRLKSISFMKRLQFDNN